MVTIIRFPSLLRGLGIARRKRHPAGQLAVEADLESATGVKLSVGFKWENGRLLTVTVAYPQLYEKKPLAALAEIVRRSVETHFKQKPEDIELSFSLGRSGSGTVAELQGDEGGVRGVSSQRF